MHNNCNNHKPDFLILVIEFNQLSWLCGDKLVARFLLRICWTRIPHNLQAAVGQGCSYHRAWVGLLVDFCWIYWAWFTTGWVNLLDYYCESWNFLGLLLDLPRSSTSSRRQSIDLDTSSSTWIGSCPNRRFVSNKNRTPNPWPVHHVINYGVWSSNLRFSRICAKGTKG